MSGERSYRLLDSGDGRKLEQVGEILLDRHAPQATWPQQLVPERWQEAAAIHHRSDRGGGHWEMRQDLPASWCVDVADDLVVNVKPTPFGHVGLFPEQAFQWAWLREIVAGRVAAGSAPRILNLFGYTGIASLSCAAAGAEVCHVDAARGIVDWARTNARTSGLENRPIRWIVDDAVAFVRREVRRDRTYDGIVLDPPTYGRGSRKETWHIESDLLGLLDLCARLLSDDPLLFVVSTHTPGYTRIVLENLVSASFPERQWNMEGGEMSLSEDGGRRLPSGHVLRCSQHPNEKLSP